MTNNEADPQRWRLLAVFAHPDDESCGPGGTLARCAAEGMSVHLVCATRGELGGAPSADKRPDGLLGELRAGELRAACRALGVRECTIFDYPDGSLRNCDQRGLEDDIVRVIRRVRPRLIMTADAKEDGDHRIIAWITTLAWMSAGARVDPHLADLLLYYHPGPMTEDDLRLDMVTVDVTAHRDRKAAALRCHATQTACTSGALRDLESAATVYETFVVAYSRLPRNHHLLTDVFQPL